MMQPVIWTGIRSAKRTQKIEVVMLYLRIRRGLWWFLLTFLLLFVFLGKDKEMRNFVSTLQSSVLAGICIGIAGFGYLMSKDIIGIVLFTFGLLAVVHYGFKLFTGTVGFCGSFVGLKIKEIPLVLIGNIIGTLLVAVLTYASPADLQTVAQGILESRLSNGILYSGLLAIGCGFIMTTAVRFSKYTDKWYPLLYGVPIFIVCGFPHCIADAFYYLSVPFNYWIQNWSDILLLYGAIVAGNAVGCNLTRLIMADRNA